MTIVLNLFKVAIYLLYLSFDNFDLCSKYCLSLNKHVELSLQLILNRNNRRYNAYIYNSRNNVNKLDARRDNLSLTRLAFKANILINYLSNASFILITKIVCIYNKRTNRNVSTSKTNLRAIRKSYLKHLFLANKYVDDDILKNN